MMNKDLERGFPIYEDEAKAIREWQLKHAAEAHNAKTVEERLANSGAIGGSYTYYFIPTSIGEIGVIKCSCGAEFCFRELD